MARARMIKPGFFLNEDLIELSPLARLLFAGLWCIADKEGRIEDRPKRIKVQLLPCDNCDTDELLSDLARMNLILRYQVDGARYIQVINFGKHQNPHQKEPASIIQGPCLSEENPGQVSEITGLAPEITGQALEITGQAGRNTVNSKQNTEYSKQKENDAPAARVLVSDEKEDLPFLEGPNPQEPVPDDTDLPEMVEKSPPFSAPPPIEARQPIPKPKRNAYTAEFDVFWTAYPGGGDKSEAFREWKAAGLERNEGLRDRICHALADQMEDQRRCLAAGQFFPNWKNCERWIKGSCWEAKPRFSAEIQAVAMAPPRSQRSGTAGTMTNVTDETIQRFLERHGEA
jgi:hypothetical protein